MSTTTSQLAIVLPGCVITRWARTLRLDSTGADSDQWAAAIELVNSSIPADAKAELFAREDSEVWIFTW